LDQSTVTRKILFQNPSAAAEQRVLVDDKSLHSFLRSFKCNEDGNGDLNPNEANENA